MKEQKKSSQIIKVSWLFVGQQSVLWQDIIPRKSNDRGNWGTSFWISIITDVNSATIEPPAVLLLSLAVGVPDQKLNTDNGPVAP